MFFTLCIKYKKTIMIIFNISKSKKKQFLQNIQHRVLYFKTETLMKFFCTVNMHSIVHIQIKIQLISCINSSLRINSLFTYVYENFQEHACTVTFFKKIEYISLISSHRRVTWILRVSHLMHSTRAQNKNNT